MTEGSFPKVDGDVLYASEINNIRTSILSIDATTDLDLNQTTNGTTTANKSYTFTAAALKGHAYLSIKINGLFLANAVIAGNDGLIALKIEATAPSAVTYFDGNVVAAPNPGGESGYYNSVYGFEYIRTLSAGEISSGLTVKLTTTATVTDTDGSGVGAFTNVQIIFSGLN